MRSSFYLLIYSFFWIVQVNANDESFCRINAMIDETLEEFRLTEERANDPYRLMSAAQELAAKAPGVRLVPGTTPGSSKKFVMLGPDGKLVGFISFLEKGGTVDVGMIQINPGSGYRGKKLSQVLYKKMLESNPAIKSIGGMLEESNKQAYYRYRFGDPTAVPPIPPHDHFAALKKTPGYRARCRAGFCEIDKLESADPMIDGQMGPFITLVTKKSE